MDVTIPQLDNTPTEIVGVDTTPNYLMDLTDADLNKFTYTGISIKIKLPLIKNTDQAIFGINTDGFIPGITHTQRFSQIMMNLFPVQVFEHAKTFVDIFYEPIALPILHKYYSYRFCKGKPRIGLRMSSNVSQTGNFQVVQASGIQRKFVSTDERYNGLRFKGTLPTSSTFAPAGITIWDVSINRHLGVTPVSRENFPALDLMKKMYDVSTLPTLNAVTQVRRNLLESQFLEEWLLFTPQNSFPSTNGNEIDISVYMDWSEVEFTCPGVPIQPIASVYPECRILNVTSSFVGKRAADVNLSTTTQWKTVLTWLPGVPGALNQENEEVESKNAQSTHGKPKKI